MIKISKILLVFSMLFSGCVSNDPFVNRNKTDQKLEQTKRQRDETTKKTERVSCQNNHGSRECLGVY